MVRKVSAAFIMSLGVALAPAANPALANVHPAATIPYAVQKPLRRRISTVATGTSKKETAAKAVSISRVSARRVRSAPCLDDRRFSLANRSLALAPTTGEAKREYNRADDDYKLFHDFTPVRNS